MELLTADGISVPSPPQYTLVSTSDSFQEMLKRLIPASRLAIDIEADSLYHYFEKVCLIQISTDDATFIIDPLAVKKIDELHALIASSKVEKVFHAAGYDTYCLRRDYGFSFANIFDTHIAAQLLGYEFLGLGALLESVLGIYHSKQRQRDDWSRRPLETEQLEYAAMDTHYLLGLRDVLESALREKGRLSWAQEEFENAATTEKTDKEFDPEGYRNIKGSRELPLQGMASLRALYVLRDQIARKLDVPSFKVMNNSVLLDLVQRPPVSPGEMFHRAGVSYRVARKYSHEIIKSLVEDREPFVLSKPVRNNWKPPSKAAKLRLEALKTWRQSKAKELNLHVGVVFPANLLESLASFPPANSCEFTALPGMRQWRAREFGEEIIQLLGNNNFEEKEGAIGSGAQ
jgi:ribonuclease D